MPSAIEWTDETWNPVTGCTPISPGCDHCYARRMANRLRGRCGYPSDDPFRVTLHPDRLDQPLRWRKSRRVFVDSMGDLFHPDVPDEFIAEVFGVMAVAHSEFLCGKETRRRMPPSKQWPNGITRVSMPKTRYGPHTFMVLTKRPERARELLTSTRFRNLVAPAAFRHAHNRTDAGHLSHQIGTREEYGRCYDPGRLWPLPNVHIGVTAEDQQRADERIPLLLQTPASVRFVSVEPMLGPIDFERVPWTTEKRHQCIPFNPLIGGGQKTSTPWKIDWLICGAETGPSTRPMNLAWARSLRDQCQASGVPFFFKKAGPGIKTPEDLDIRQFPHGA